MRFKLTVLGCSSALPTISKYQTAHVLNVREQFYLLDCGEGVQKQLKRYDISIMSLNQIFISHLHGDHVFGLFGLISSMGLLGRTRVLEIFAPAPIQEIVNNHIKYFDRWLPYKIKCHTVDTKNRNIVYENSSITVETIPLKHSVPTAGYLFREKTPERNIDKSVIDKYNLGLAEIVKLKRGEDIFRDNGESIMCSDVTYAPYSPRSFAYCCDTGYTERYLEQIKGVDMLMQETTYHKADKVNAKKRFHCTTHDTATIAKNAEVGKLIITHFSTRYNTPLEVYEQEAKEVFENTYLAKEGREFEIPFVKNNSINKC